MTCRTILFLGIVFRAVGAPERKNILFILVDDLRPNLGVYGFDLGHSPNIDKFAAGALTFTRAYAQYSFCAPSRNSLMTGRLPDTVKAWNFQNHFREPGVGTEWRSLPQYFKEHGYITTNSGKLYHAMLPPNNDYPLSWSERPFTPECVPPECNDSTASGPFDPEVTCIEDDGIQGENWCAANVSKDETDEFLQLADQKVTSHCIQMIKMVKAKGKNFFVACGLHKPHTPWTFPFTFLKHFPANLSDIPLPENPFIPKDMPLFAWHYPADLGGMNMRVNETQNENNARLLRRAYYAAIAFMDYNVGKILKALDEEGLTQSTAVVFTSDNGWSLGEQNLWAKMTNFENGVKVPLIIRAPWIASSKGRKTKVLAELVDLYATMADLAGLPDPRSQGEAINGTSLLPVLRDPNNIGLKDAAFSQLAKVSVQQPFRVETKFFRKEVDFMGYSYRDHQWRFNVWFRFDPNFLVPMVDKILAQELYDHTDDHGDLELEGKFELQNLAKANHNLTDQLREIIMDRLGHHVESPDIWSYLKTGESNNTELVIAKEFLDEVKLAAKKAAEAARNASMNASVNASMMEDGDQPTTSEVGQHQGHQTHRGDPFDLRLGTYSDDEYNSQSTVEQQLARVSVDGGQEFTDDMSWSTGATEDGLATVDSASDIEPQNLFDMFDSVPSVRVDDDTYRATLTTDPMESLGDLNGGGITNFNRTSTFSSSSSRRRPKSKKASLSEEQPLKGFSTELKGFSTEEKPWRGPDEIQDEVVEDVAANHARKFLRQQMKPRDYWDDTPPQERGIDFQSSSVKGNTRDHGNLRVD